MNFGNDLSKKFTSLLQFITKMVLGDKYASLGIILDNFELTSSMTRTNSKSGSIVSTSCVTCSNTTVVIGSTLNTCSSTC
jgi:hypothetical protein